VNRLLFRIPELKKEVDLQEAEYAERARIKKLQQKKWENAPKRLGRDKFLQQDIQVLLTDELPSNLRTLVPRFNLMEDRFNRLKQRNMLEHNVPRPSTKRHKEKHVEKYSSRAYRLEQEKLYAEKPPKPVKASEPEVNDLE